jgi:hypothetical protein
VRRGRKGIVRQQSVGNSERPPGAGRPKKNQINMELIHTLALRNGWFQACVMSSRNVFDQLLHFECWTPFIQQSHTKKSLAKHIVSTSLYFALVRSCQTN